MYKYFRKESHNAKFKLCTSPTETNGPVNTAHDDHIELLDACVCDSVYTTAVDKFLVTTDELVLVAATFEVAVEVAAEEADVTGAGVALVVTALLDAVEFSV